MEGETEFFFQCPFCFSKISMVIEVYCGSQTYIEDCEVCCRPSRYRTLWRKTKSSVSKLRGLLIKYPLRKTLFLLLQSFRLHCKF